MDDFSKLRALAEAATPGPYEFGRGKSGLSVGVYGADGRQLASSSWHECSPHYPTQHQTVANFKFFVAANPAVILSLIDALYTQQAICDAHNAVLERLTEAEDIIAERDDRLALVDRIADLIGLPHNQELDQVAFELWFSGERSRSEAMRKALEPFKSGGNWGRYKAWLTCGPPTQADGVRAAKQITEWQVAVDRAALEGR